MLVVLRRLLRSLAVAALLWSGLSCARTPAPEPERPAEPPRSGGQHGTGAPAWHDLGPIPDIPSGRVRRWPTLTVLGDDLVLTANAIFPDSGARNAKFRVETITGASFGRPAGTFLFGHARAVVHAATGTFHLVWGESDEPPANAGGWPHRYTALWHAAYARGAWSAPTRIMTAYDIAWGSQAGPLAVDRAGCVHVVVPLFGDEREGLQHARGACAPWVVTRIATRATYGAVTTTDDGAVLAALTGTDLSSPLDRNIVQVLRASEGGTWTLLSRVQFRASRDRPEQVWIASRGRQLHLAWVHVLDRAGKMLDASGRLMDRGGRVFVHLRSGDGGTRWADTVMTAPIPELVFGARFVAHRCGVDAVFDATTDGATFRAGSVALGRDGATPAPIFPRSIMSIEPAPVLLGDTLLVVAGLLEAGSDTSVAHLASRPACHDAVIH